MDFIRKRGQDRALVRAAGAPAFATVWYNPEDDAYERIAALIADSDVIAPG